jgi:MerR family transcriptional regulator, thiopeptide resistance regulator
MYLVQQFAKLAGVTVRTLHHYDRLGLLSPNHRSESGYRLYTNQDMVRLERIMVLRYLGLPLKQIASLLSERQSDDHDVAQLLRTQAVVLRERRESMTRVIRAVEAAEQSLDTVQQPDWKLFQTIIQEVSMQDNTEWSKKYYSEAGQQAVEERKALWSPELQEKVTAQWNEMFAKVEAAIAAGEDPASEHGRQLASEWHKLVEGFTGGNREISKGLNAMVADQDNWPKPTQQQYAIKPELIDFIRKASVPRA